LDQALVKITQILVMPFLAGAVGSQQEGIHGMGAAARAFHWPQYQGDPAHY
jgi:hypothetical protein